MIESLSSKISFVTIIMHETLIDRKIRLLVFGASGHAKVVIDMLEMLEHFQIVGLIDNYKSLGTLCANYSVIGCVEDLSKIIKKEKIDGGVIAISDNWSRHLVKKQIEGNYPKFTFYSVVHPRANIAKSAIINPGTVVMPGVNIGPNCIIGSFCILNTMSSLDHDSIMEDFSSLAPGAVTGGNVKIGYFSAICLGAKIIHQINIGDQTVIGAGSVVVRNIPKMCVAYGVPAKIVRKRRPGESYF